MYSQEVADAICARLAEGESLRKAAAFEDTAPSTVLEWVKTNPAFAEQYAHARARGYELMADEILDISDESKEDTYVDANGNERTDTEVIARSKLRVDSRKWLLSKMLPKVYGDKITQEHTGPGGGPVQIIATDHDEAL